MKKPFAIDKGELVRTFVIYYGVHNKYWETFSSDVAYATLFVKETEQIIEKEKKIGCSGNSYLVIMFLLNAYGCYSDRLAEQNGKITGYMDETRDLGISTVNEEMTFSFRNMVRREEMSAATIR